MVPRSSIIIRNGRHHPVNVLFRLWVSLFLVATVSSFVAIPIRSFVSLKTSRLPNNNDNTNHHHHRRRLSIPLSRRRHITISVTKSTRQDTQLFALPGNNNNNNNNNNSNKNDNSNNNTVDTYFDWSTTLSFIAGQSVLILLAIGISIGYHTPNFGCGPTIQFTKETFLLGSLATLPLGVFALYLDGLEDSFVALQNVSKATQRSVLTLLGGTWKPATAIIVCLLLSLAAGWGEEMLFRGLLQYELTHALTGVGPAAAAAAMTTIPPSPTTFSVLLLIPILVSSIIFGALHAVTPLYALLAGLASVYFGSLYVFMDYNLAVPIVCHTLYDVVALLYAHWVVTRTLNEKEREEIYYNWELRSSGASDDDSKK